MLCNSTWRQGRYSWRSNKLRLRATKGSGSLKSSESSSAPRANCPMSSVQPRTAVPRWSRSPRPPENSAVFRSRHKHSFQATLPSIVGTHLNQTELADLRRQVTFKLVEIPLQVTSRLICTIRHCLPYSASYSVCHDWSFCRLTCWLGDGLTS